MKQKTLREVEAVSGISNAHLSQIEKGAIEKPSLDLLQKLSSYYQVELSYLESLAGYSTIEQADADSRLIPLKYVTADDINSFANSKEAEGILPELVRDLIVSTVNHDFLEMPIGGSVFMHGWDGLLNCKGKPDIYFAPEGFSCWEMSKAKNVTKKFEADFLKRTNKPLNQTIENSTYVHVTFRRLSKEEKAKFIDNGKAKKMWKDIRVIDAEDLALWLERSPVVALLFAKRIGIFPASYGLRPLKSFWSEWWNSTDPAIDQSLLLEAGKKCDDAFNFRCNPSTEYLEINSNDIDIGIAFFYSILSSIENKVLSLSLISRSILVENLDAFRLLATRGKQLILIPTFQGAPIGEAKANGHQIISVINNFIPDKLNSVSRIRKSVMASFLKFEGGYTEEKAQRIAQSCYGNLAVLHSMLVNKGEEGCIIWSKPEHRHSILPLAMLGGWSANSENDQGILKKFTHNSYEEIESYLDSLPDENRPFQRINSTYSFYQEYCFTHLIDHLTDKKLVQFFNIAKEILCDVDTKYELDPDSRHAASIFGKGHRYSWTLRTGVASTLAILATMSNSKCQFQIDGIVREALKDKIDWKFWASLSDIMTLLAEAAPSAFLEALENACQKEEFLEIFKQRTFMGGIEYSHILWSLELCAWDKRHFTQVTKILMSLAEYENKSNNYTNQPSKSLWNIHRIWRNQSSLGFYQRIEVLKSLEGFNQNQVWKLLLSIIPKSNEIGNYTVRPKFRDLEHVLQDVDSDLNYINVMNILVDYVIELLSKDSMKWCDVMDLVFNIRPQSYQMKLVDKLIIVDTLKLSPDVCLNIWHKLEKELSHHLQYPNNDWSIKGEILTKLQKAYALYTPTAPFARWSHIFKEHISHPIIENGDNNYIAKASRLKDLQKRALHELIPSVKNLNILSKLLASVPDAAVLGFVFAEIFNEGCVDAIKIAKDYPKGLDFITGLVYTLHRLNGDEWLNLLLKEPTLSDCSLRANIFLTLPYTKTTWKKLEGEQLTIQDEYWNKTKRYFVGDSTEDAIYVINKFFYYKRPLSAFYVLANFEHRGKAHLSSDLCMKVLDELISYNLSNEAETVDFTMFDFHLENVLKDLSSRNDVDKSKLALIEWNFLPLFQFRRKPENLIYEVSQKPELFVDMLKLAYMKDDLSINSPANEGAVSRAWSFLHESKTLPGMDKDGNFNFEHFLKWFPTARSLATGCERVKAFNIIMGQLFAYSPIDPEDSGWPHKAIRDVFEKFGTEEMESNFLNGITNKRGGYIKAFGEGGSQEEQLAKKYGDYAKISEILWPKTSKVLRSVESYYKADAHQEELRALQE